MKMLHLAAGLSLPLDAATETFGIFGQKGSGKSSTAARFVEQLVKAGGRAVIADPTGVWYGLMHDGIGTGLAGIVLGGEHGDVPLDPTKGRIVAEFVVSQTTYPVVVLDLKLMRKAERTKFMLAFMETLYHENREALHVVLDEAHQFAPTQAREGGETIPLLGAVEDVVALGRSRGLGITMISQRFATLNANVREQIGTLIVHRLVGSLDRKALRGWIEANGEPEREREVIETIAKLRTGRALLWSPAFMAFFGVVDIEAPETFDSRATPKVGQKVKRPGKRAAVDLDTLKQRMAETIEQAEANDPVKLRAKVTAASRAAAEALDELTRVKAVWAPPDEVAALKRQIAEMETRPVEPIRVPLLTDEDRALLRQVAELVPSVTDVAFAIEQRASQMAPAPRPPAAAPTPPPVRQMAQPATPRVAPAVPATQPTVLDPADAPRLRAGARRMLDVLVAGYPMRYTVAQWAALAKMKRTGGTFGTYVSDLRRSGFLDERDGTVGPTQAALDYSGVVPGTPKSSSEVIDMWRTRLRGGARRMLDEIASVGPISREALAERTGIAATGGTFGTYLSDIRRTGLVEETSDGYQLAEFVRG